MDEKIKDWKACRELVKSILSNYRIPYLTISPTYSICPVHGYISGEQFECPKCKAQKEKELKEKLLKLEAERDALIKNQ